MQELHLPGYAFKVRSAPQGEQIFDVVRRKYVALTPEEWVRQHFLNFLIHHRGCPASLIKVERGVDRSTLNMRTDIVVHDNNADAIALVECKAHDVRIDNKTLDQVFRYDRILEVEYVILTNGLEHYCCRVDREQKQLVPLNEIPRYEQMVANTNNING